MGWQNMKFSQNACMLPAFRSWVMWRFIKKNNNEVARAQEEVKRSQARLQKLVDKFSLVETSRHANHVEHSNINVISEPNAHFPPKKFLRNQP